MVETPPSGFTNPIVVEFIPLPREQEVGLELETADVKRGQPCKLWLEFKLRDDVLTGSLIAFSQREFYSGPLSHWVELGKE